MDIPNALLRYWLELDPIEDYDLALVVKETLFDLGFEVWMTETSYELLSR